MVKNVGGLDGLSYDQESHTLGIWKNDKVIGRHGMKIVTWSGVTDSNGTANWSSAIPEGYTTVCVIRGLENGIALAVAHMGNWGYIHYGSQDAFTLVKNKTVTLSLILAIID